VVPWGTRRSWRRQHRTRTHKIKCIDNVILFVPVQPPGGHHVQGKSPGASPMAISPNKASQQPTPQIRRLSRPPEAIKIKDEFRRVSFLCRDFPMKRLIFYMISFSVSLCCSLGKDFVYHACGHEFKSRLKWKVSNFPHHLLLGDYRGIWLGAHYNLEVRFSSAVKCMKEPQVLTSLTDEIFIIISWRCTYLGCRSRG